MVITSDLERRAKRLRPMVLPEQLEDVAKSLFEETSCGSRSLWPLEPGSLSENADLRGEFYRLAHEGMWAAQERFLHRISSDHAFVPGEQALYRNAMDVIAWQFLQKQLCFARRVYREQKQPSLLNSNLQSVERTARFFREESPASMPLITDLTTFVQIGDILSFDPINGMSIVEVKEGEKNHQIAQFAGFYRESQCEQFKQVVSETESPSTFKQFERMLRQMDRMEFAKQVIGSGKARDPDSSIEYRIPEPYIPMQEWDGELNRMFEKALDRGWALDVIDGCLFVACYADKKTLHASPFLFLPWLERHAEGEFCPISRMVDCMTQPLALPTYLLPTFPERMFDLMFGRLHVCMGISLPGLVAECEKHGIVARPATKKERKGIHGSRGDGVKYKGQWLVLQRGEKSLILGDGMFMRWMFNFQRPLSVINSFFDNMEAFGKG